MAMQLNQQVSETETEHSLGLIAGHDGNDVECLKHLKHAPAMLRKHKLNSLLLF